jgi:hypothetical protein
MEEHSFLPVLAYYWRRRRRIKGSLRLSFLACHMNLRTTVKSMSRASQKGGSHWVPVAHACIPSYSEGRDQEDHSSKPAWTNSL